LSSRPPPASFSWTRIAASKSWLHSRPARSPDNSDLRCHSMSAATIARSAQPPIGMNPNDDASRIRCMSMVRYTACPLSAWPSSCPMMKRISSVLIRSYIPEVITMKGWSMPIV
jgi:hypothetical protein